MVEIKTSGESMTAFLSGEIDHHAAREIRLSIDERIQTLYPGLLILDFEKVTFMDSSGIGLIMGRYRSMQSIGGKVTVKNAQKPLLRVMRLAGLEKLVRFE